VVVHVGLAAVFLGWVLMRLVAVGDGRVVVLVLCWWLAVRCVQVWPLLRKWVT
jgi:hypothetical protein